MMSECYDFEADVKNFTREWTKLNTESHHFKLIFNKCPIYALMDEHWGNKTPAYFSEFVKAGFQISFEDGIWKKGCPTLLTYVCRYKKADAALAIIDHVSLKEVDMYGCTALWYACEHQLVDVALAIIKKGNCNIDFYDNCMEPPGAFESACSHRTFQVIDAMLESEEFNINSWNDDETKCATKSLSLFTEDLRHYAIKMIENGEIDPTQENCDGYNLLHDAILYEEESIAVAIIKTGKVDLKKVVADGTYLQMAKKRSLNRVIDAIRNAPDYLSEYNGIMFFSISIRNNQSGEELDISDLDAYESDYIADESMQLYDLIYDKVVKCLEKCSESYFQVEPYTRNGGPLIDYSIKGNFSYNPLEDLEFHFEIDQENGWTAIASTDCAYFKENNSDEEY